MKTSASIELIWNLAAREAIAAQSQEIEPEHFFEALMKFAELPVEEVRNLSPGAEVARELASEVEAVRQELASRSIDSTQARRGLRARLGTGEAQYDGGQMHRSQASRELFDAAARLADDLAGEALLANHFLLVLLESPTETISEVLGAAGTGMPKPSDTPLLDDHGQDLTKMAAEGMLLGVEGRDAECKALCQALARKDTRSVLLIGDSDDAAKAVVMTLLNAVARRETPAVLRRRRFVDVSELDPYGPDGTEAVKGLEQLLAEAACADELVLLIPPLEAAREGEPGRQWIDQLSEVLAKRCPQCICRVAPDAFESHVKPDPKIQRAVRLMWIQAESASEIPWEL
ncbi:MAG: Clp protease N-terminal domain-containing protein [Planctomycetota bacterium]